MSDTQTKHTPGFALVALLEQIAQWKRQGAEEINFGALASHPETDEGCTFGDLIEPARAEFAGISSYLATVLVQEQCNGIDRAAGRVADVPCSFEECSRAVAEAIPELFAEYWEALRV